MASAEMPLMHISQLNVIQQHDAPPPPPRSPHRPPGLSGWRRTFPISVRFLSRRDFRIAISKCQERRCNAPRLLHASHHPPLLRPPPTIQRRGPTTPPRRRVHGPVVQPLRLAVPFAGQPLALRRSRSAIAAISASYSAQAVISGASDRCPVTSTISACDDQGRGIPRCGRPVPVPPSKPHQVNLVYWCLWPVAGEFRQCVY
jgi:hypothetical protein